MKLYWTKKRKTQLRYWIALAVAFHLGVIALGFSHTYTEKTIIGFTYSIVNVPVVHAAELPVESVEDTIRRLAQETGFKWPDYLVRLAYCESRFDAKATNDNGRYGMDRGVFQINNHYHAEVTDDQAFDVEWATRWTMDRINKGYQHEWACNSIIKKK